MKRYLLATNTATTALISFVKSKTMILFLLAIGIISSYRLIQSGYFSMQDDMQVFRLQQFDLCVKDGQIPCRQVPDGGLGYGYPLYNFYSPLPYAVAEFFHLVGFSFIDSLKISFAIPNLIRPFSMYFLASYFFGPLGGLVSSALYTFAPYQAINGFVRGSIAELWALSLTPLLFYAIAKNNTNIYILSLTFLLLSHNLTSLYIIPLLIIFSVINKKKVFVTINSIYSLLISSFFVLPAFFEKNLVTVDTMTQGYFSYINHFTTIKQLFISNFWGYGASQWGPIDGMSFQIGYILWLIPAFVLIKLVIARKITKNKNVIFFIVVGLVALFLSHNKSTFIWNNLKIIQFYQFPWRFLGLTILAFSVASGKIIQLIPKGYTKLVGGLLILFTLLTNITYFHEDIWYSKIDDRQKLSTKEYVRQSGSGLKDYWPKSALQFPSSYAPKEPILISGQAKNIFFQKTSQVITGKIFVTSSQATLNIPQSYFPNWQLYVNGRPSNYQIEPILGQIQLSLPKGSHYYVFRFNNTNIRTISNFLSIVGIILYLFKLKRENHT